MTKLPIKPSTPELIIGLDPSSGSKSHVGVCVMDARKRQLLDVDEIAPFPKYYTVEQRVRCIALALTDILKKYHYYESVLVATEYTIMKGKGGESLNRAIGAMIGTLPLEKDGWAFTNVQNTSVKLLVAGTGKAEKDAVAHGTLRFFMQDKESCEIIKSLTTLEKWDIMDSIAIAITAYLQYQYQGNNNNEKKFKAK